MNSSTFVDPEILELRREFQRLLREDAGDALGAVEESLKAVGDAAFVARKKNQRSAENDFFGDFGMTTVGKLFGVATNTDSILGNIMGVLQTDLIEGLTGVESAKKKQGLEKNSALSRILGAEKYFKSEEATSRSDTSSDSERSDETNRSDESISRTTRRHSDETKRKISESVRNSERGKPQEVRVVNDVEAVSDVRIIDSMWDDSKSLNLLEMINSGISDLLELMSGATADEKAREVARIRRETESTRESSSTSTVASAIMGGKSESLSTGLKTEIVGEVVGEVIGNALGIAAAGGIAGMAAKAMNFASVAGRVAGRALPVVGSVLSLGLDAFAGVDLAEQWDVSKTAGVFGSILGGANDGIMGALAGSGKWALTGAAIGSVVPVVGTLAGGLAGAAIGAVMGFIGGERIANFAQNATDEISDLATDFGAGFTEWFDQFVADAKEIVSSVVGAVTGFLDDYILSPLGTLADQILGTEFVLDEESLQESVDLISVRMSDRESEIRRHTASLVDVRNRIADAEASGDINAINALTERSVEIESMVASLREESARDAEDILRSSERLSKSRRTWSDRAREWTSSTLIEPTGRLVDQVFGTTTVIDPAAIETELAELRQTNATRSEEFELRRHQLAVVVRDMVNARHDGDIALVESLEARERALRSGVEDMVLAEARDSERIEILTERLEESKNTLNSRVGDWLSHNVVGTFKSMSDSLFGTALASEEQSEHMSSVLRSARMTISGYATASAASVTAFFGDIMDFEFPSVNVDVSGIVGDSAGAVVAGFTSMLGFEFPGVDVSSVVSGFVTSSLDWLASSFSVDFSSFGEFSVLSSVSNAWSTASSLFETATSISTDDITMDSVSDMVGRAAGSISSFFGSNLSFDVEEVFNEALGGFTSIRDIVSGAIPRIMTRVSDFVSKIFTWEYWFGSDDDESMVSGAKLRVATARDREARRGKLVASVEDSVDGTTEGAEAALSMFKTGEIDETELKRRLVDEARTDGVSRSDREDIEDALAAIASYETYATARTSEVARELETSRAEFVDGLTRSIDTFGFDSDSVFVTRAIRDFEIGEIDLTDLRERLVEVQRTGTSNERREAELALETFGAYESRVSSLRETDVDPTVRPDSIVLSELGTVVDSSRVIRNSTIVVPEVTVVPTLFEGDPSGLSEANRIDYETEETMAAARAAAHGGAVAAQVSVRNSSVTNNTSVMIPASVHNNEATVQGGSVGRHSLN